MKILYDYQAFIQRIGGVSRYHAELMRNFPKEVETLLPPILSDNVYLREQGIKHRQFILNSNNQRKYDIYKVLNIIQSLSWIKIKKYDIFHPTFFNPYFVGHCKKPIVITMHDLNHWKYPELTVKAEILQEKERIVCNAASHIIAISEETKRDLMKYIGVSEEKVSVIYHGISQQLITCSDNPLVKYPYLLYIGGRRGYKNFKTFLQAFAHVNNEDIHLVCTGIPFNAEEAQLLHKLGIDERVHQMFVSDEELNNLLYHAVVFVYPSLAEGFGLPILEAFRCGCPCIVSDLLCFHEVAADAALYFNPTNTDNISHTIEKALCDSETLKAISRKGKERVRLFTWEKTSNDTLRVYNSLM